MRLSNNQTLDARTCVSTCKMNKTVTVQVTPQVIAPQPDDSPVMEILESVKEKLAETPGLNYIDMDYGQLDDYSPNFPVKWPCALLDISQAGYSNLGQDAARKPRNRQQAEAELSVTVANLKLTNTSRNAPIQQKQDANVIHGIIQHIHELLHGYAASEVAGPMIRTGMQRIRRDDGVQEYRISYAFAMHNV